MSFATAPTVWATNQLLTGDESIITWVGCDGSMWPISGGIAPMPGAQEGAALGDIKGLMGSFKHLDQTSARQDGATWLDAVWDPLELDFTIHIFGLTPSGFRFQQAGWMNSWDPKLTGKLVWWTRHSGERWLRLRLLKEPTDQIKLTPAMVGTQAYTWTARADIPFWQSFDSVSSLVASNSTTLTNPAGGTKNFLALWNRGDQVAWPRYIIQGPGTFTLGDGVTSSQVIFGPLTTGQTALITTVPSIRSVTDLNGDNLYPLMSGRFDNPIPASPTGIHIPCSVTGATASVTQINAALTPMWKWPE
jgi:hypothetical protein